MYIWKDSVGSKLIGLLTALTVKRMMVPEATKPAEVTGISLEG